MQSKYLVHMMPVTACVLLYLKFVLNYFTFYMYVTSTIYKENSSVNVVTEEQGQ